MRSNKSNKLLSLEFKKLILSYTTISKSSNKHLKIQEVKNINELLKDSKISSQTSSLTSTNK